MTDTTDNEELRGLVEQWRASMTLAADRVTQTENRILDKCADELEQVIEDE